MLMLIFLLFFFVVCSSALSCCYFGARPLRFCSVLNIVLIWVASTELKVPKSPHPTKVILHIDTGGSQLSLVFFWLPQLEALEVPK